MIAPYKRSQPRRLPKPNYTAALIQAVGAWTAINRLLTEHSNCLTDGGRERLSGIRDQMQEHVLDLEVMRASEHAN